MIRIIISFWKALAWGIIILILSVANFNQNTSHLFIFKILYMDKIVHGMFYFIFTILLLDGFFSLNSEKVIVKRVFLVTLFISAFYGTGIEFIQKYLTTTRTFDVYDILTNISGILIAFLTFSSLKKLVAQNE